MMTTKAAERAYEAQHVRTWQGKPTAIYNPHGNPEDELPTIYGYNAGSWGTWGMGAQLVAEDGEALGNHLCSAEAYMPADLGVIEGSRPDRHETFREHYPNGYRMEFVGLGDVPTHTGLQSALSKCAE